MFTLYEFYDYKNNLLYIGITENFPRRLYEHSKRKHWYKHIANIRLFYYGSRGELEENEKQRIKSNEPLFNKIYNSDNVEKAIIECCVEQLSDYIYKNNSIEYFNGDEYETIELHTFRYKLFETVEYIIPDISWNSPQFKRVVESVLHLIENKTDN